MLQTEAYLMIVIYGRKKFILQAQGPAINQYIKDIQNITNMLIDGWPAAVAQLLEHLNTKVRSRV